MNYLISLPSKLKDCPGNYGKNYYFDSDPEEMHLGSGGGTSWIVNQFNGKNLDRINEKKILIHAGGKGSRLPAYAPSGKVFAPIPVYRWKTGQKIDQTLIDIQSEFYSSIMEKTNDKQNLLIASGDVLLNCNDIPSIIPNADIVIISTWVEATVATNHGVLFATLDDQKTLDFAIQKPTFAEIESLMTSHVFMVDTGCWILSDNAVEVLNKKCSPIGKKYFDLYSNFGQSLGKNPQVYDEEISNLTCAIINIEDGDFFHIGTTRELVSSINHIQNTVKDPRSIQKHSLKDHPSLFVQNCDIQVTWTEANYNIWIENSCVRKGWRLNSDTVITGVPENDWNIYVPKGICIDVVPIDDDSYALRPYGFDDKFTGMLSANTTKWMGKSIPLWVDKEDIELQSAKIFPVLNKIDFEKKAGRLLSWMINSASSEDLSDEYHSCELISADDIISRVNLKRLFEQRKIFLRKNLVELADNYRKSVFYQSNLSHIANLYEEYKLQYPHEIDPETNDYVTLTRDSAFRGNIKKSFEILRNQIITKVSKVEPKYDVISDQIIWGRSPARIDLAGGWSDTPPYSIYNGGSVVNIALDLNGQQPIQVYVKPIKENYFVIRSIDTGVSEKVNTFEQLEAYKDVGSSFCIPKAALCLAGFSNDFSITKYNSLEQHLRELGGGLEITLFAAIPKGSGLGTSSILASTLLGSLSNLCSLNWTEHEICYRTLILEQMVSSGGGWQDQYGAVFGGVKLCMSNPGLQKNIQLKRLPTDIFVSPETSNLWLLYYTGQTRVAKNILDDIVKNMFLNKTDTLQITNLIKQHSKVIADAIQFCDYSTTANYIKESWELNKKLDSGVTTPEIESLISRISDYSLGYKLAGAGGGGYMLICAKDVEAVSKIKKELIDNPINNRARFIGMSLNNKGLEITRS